MALSGSFSGSVFNAHHKVRVDWTGTQNIANNTTTITAKMYYVHDWSISIGARNNAHSITIDGTTTTFSSSAISANSGEHLIGTATKTIQHNSDGAKSISMSASFALKVTLNGTYYSNITASATITLDNITRGSQPTLSASSVALGSAVTINTNRTSDKFTHTLTYAFNGASGTIASGVGDSVKWTPPLELAKQIPSSTSGTVSIRCKTYNGSSLVGETIVSLVITVPTSAIPVISKIAFTDPNGYAETYGYVQNKSKVQITVTAEGIYDSEIKSYKILLNGNTYTSNNTITGVLTNVGENVVTVTVTDSRGRTATKKATFTVLAYTSPTISVLTASRCLSDGTSDEDGGYVKIVVGATITALNNTNTKAFKLTYKKSTDDSYTTVKKWTDSYTVGETVIAVADADYSYNIRFAVADAFGASVADVSIGSAFTLMDFNSSGKGIAFGKVSEQDAFECALEAFFEKVNIGGSTSDYSLNTPSLLCDSYLRTTGNSGWYNQTYGGGWYMKDANWVRSFGNKNVYSGGEIRGGIVTTLAGANLDTLNDSAVKKHTVTFGSWQSMALYRGNGSTIGIYILGVYIGNSGDTLTASDAITIRTTEGEFTLNSPVIAQRDWGIAIASSTSGVSTFGACIFTTAFNVSAVSS